MLDVHLLGIHAVSSVSVEHWGGASVSHVGG